MPRLLIRILLFLSSYAPLFGLLAWRSRSCQIVWISLACIALVGMMGLLTFLVVSGRFQGARLVITRLQPRDAETLAYVATYLIPFLSLDLTEGDDLISFALFMAILGIIAVTSHSLFVNPVLSLLGYHTYEVVDEDNNVYFLVSRESVAIGTTVRPISVGRYVRFVGWRRRRKHLRD